MTKTWKIGEYCRGGIITARIIGKEIYVCNKMWGTNKELQRLTVQSDSYTAFDQLDEFLQNLTTDYYAGQVMQWIKENCNLLMARS